MDFGIFWGPGIDPSIDPGYRGMTIILILNLKILDYQVAFELHFYIAAADWYFSVWESVSF